MESVHSFIAVYLATVENMLLQCTLHIQKFLIKQQRRLKEIILQHLLNLTPPNHLFDFGLILQFSRERKIWMKK